MGDDVPSTRGSLKRTKSATFSPTVGHFFADDTLNSLGAGFGAFANESSDMIPSTSAFARFEDDTTGSAISSGGGVRIGFSRGELRETSGDDYPFADHDMIPRTRSLETFINSLKDDIDNGIIPSATAPCTPRTPMPVDTSGQTPRCRSDMSDIPELRLELVGTTLVAKSANDQLRLDVSLLCRCVVGPIFSPVSFPPACECCYSS